MHMDLTIRFDYGSIVPWVGRRRRATSYSGRRARTRSACETPVHTHGAGKATVADFVVEAGEKVPFVARVPRVARATPPRLATCERAIKETARWWRKWAKQCTYDGEWKTQVMRSLITLKALTYAPTGGIVAAPTTSLPEWLGSVRNWDYRYCWLRDATLTLLALTVGGYTDEALAWRDWLLRAAAGDPEDLQIMYGPAGERRLTEFTVDWLDGLRGLHPGARRQRGERAVPARRLRRGARDALPHPQAHARRRRAPGLVGARVRAARRARGRSGAIPTRASGRCAARASTSRTRR